MLESDSIFKLKVKERTVTCYDDGEEGYGDDLCASGTDYSYIEMPEQTLADGMFCLRIVTLRCQRVYPVRHEAEIFLSQSHTDQVL